MSSGYVGACQLSLDFLNMQNTQLINSLLCLTRGEVLQRTRSNASFENVQCLIVSLRLSSNFVSFLPHLPSFLSSRLLINYQFSKTTVRYVLVISQSQYYNYIYSRLEAGYRRKNWRIILKWDLRIQVIRIGGEWIQLKFISDVRQRILFQ